MSLDYINNADHYKKYLDMQNSEEFQTLRTLYQSKTMMDILGVARQENPHSSFLRWMLSPNEGNGLEDYGFKKFCETLCFAFIKYGSEYLVEETLRNPLLEEIPSESKAFDGIEPKEMGKKLLFFQGNGEENGDEKKKLITSLMNGNFDIKTCKVEREKPIKARRADIWIDCTIAVKQENKEKSIHLWFLVENKVTSSENDNQTYYYMKEVLKQMKMRDDKMKDDDLTGVDYFIPVYLYPASNKEMKDAVSKTGKFPCVNHLFLVINYQYLLDGMIIPCYTITEDSITKQRLRDYMSCLGQSIFASETEDPKAGRELVMAVGPTEKRLALKLWEDHEDVLRDIGLNINEDSHFIVRDNADRQFYRAVFTPITQRLLSSDNLPDDKAEANQKLIDVLNAKQRKLYKVMMKNGKKPITLGSYQGQGMNTAALGYLIIRQFLTLNKENESPYPIEHIIEILRGKIKNNWLDGILMTQSDYEKLEERWRKAAEERGETGCVCDNKQCPLDDKKNNQSCPMFPGLTNEELRMAYYSKKGEKTFGGVPRRGEGCACIYWMLNDFFVKDLENSEIFKKEAEKEVLKRISCNVIFDKVSYGKRKEENVYIGKWWFTEDIEKLLNVLEKEFRGYEDIRKYFPLESDPEDPKKLEFDEDLVGINEKTLA
ncbi:MAG: PD-(D/E)XK nuclease family protein [Lachnospiraceae bacterium]|nr:PD-(D/E)XK nuclease family protein [Lachnospiraceae bacterium]